MDLDSVFFSYIKRIPFSSFLAVLLLVQMGVQIYIIVIIDILSRMFENLDSILSKPQACFVCLSIILFSRLLYFSIIILGAVYDKMMTYLYRNSQVSN